MDVFCRSKRIKGEWKAKNQNSSAAPHSIGRYSFLPDRVGLFGCFGKMCGLADLSSKSFLIFERFSFFHLLMRFTTSAILNVFVWLSEISALEMFLPE